VSGAALNWFLEYYLFESALVLVLDGASTATHFGKHGGTGILPVHDEMTVPRGAGLLHRYSQAAAAMH
jgi:hypothetical protein